MFKDTYIKNNSNILIGSNIRKIRLEKEMRSCDVVRKMQLLGISITASAYTKIEKNKQHITASQFKSIIEILDCDPLELLS